MLEVAGIIVLFGLVGQPPITDDLADDLNPVAESVAARETPAPDSEPGAAEYRQGLELLKQGQAEEAIVPLELAAAAHYRGSDSFLVLRDAYEQAYGLEGATLHLEDKVRETPKDPAARNNLACFYMRERRWSEAKTMLLSSLAMDPEEVDARFNLGFLQAQMGQNTGALEHYEGILERYPKHVRALAEICFIISQRESEPARAEPYCARAAEAAPTDLQLQMNLGLVRMRMGDLTGASRVFEKLADDEVAHGNSARTYLGYVEMQRGELDSARKRFETVVASAPEAETGEALIGLARVHQTEKNYHDAATYYRRAYRLTGSGMLLGAMFKVYLQRYFYLVIGLLLALMGVLLWRYLGPKATTPPSPVPA